MIRLESLNSLLKLKEQSLQVQRADYQRLLDIEHGLQAELREHQQQVEQFIIESQSATTAFTRDRLMQNKHYLELLTQAEKQLRQKLEQAAQLVKEAFASLNEILQEYRVLERLFKRTVASNLVDTLSTQFKLDDEMALLAQGGL